MKVYCIDAARVITDSTLVVQLQKSDADPVKYEERLTNPCLMSAELAVVHKYRQLQQFSSRAPLQGAPASRFNSMIRILLPFCH